MSSAKLTLIGFYTWLDSQNDDLFLNLRIPADIDRDTLINNILMRGGEFEVLYSNPDFMKVLIGTWSKKWESTFERWIKALSIEYNPLENYDRIEEWSDNANNIHNESTDLGRVHEGNSYTDTQNQSKVDGSSVASSKSSSQTSGRTDNVSDNKISAYNASTLQPNTEDVSSGSSSLSDSSSNSTSSSEYNMSSMDSSESNSEYYYDSESVYSRKDENDSSNHTGRMHGNIGVTTSQQMLQSELDIATWNVYEHITDLFLHEFVIPLY